MKTFNLVRTEDVSGISGTGVVGEGCVFHDGKVALHWFGSVHSIEIHDSLEDLLTIHGHGGLTTVEWDKPPSEPLEMTKEAIEQVLDGLDTYYYRNG